MIAPPSRIPTTVLPPTCKQQYSRSPGPAREFGRCKPSMQPASIRPRSERGRPELATCTRHKTGGARHEAGAARRPGLTLLLAPMPQADSELERLLAKSPDAALHLLGDSSHGRLRLGVRPQFALIFLGPGAALNPPFCRATASFHSLFLPLSHSRISTVGLESISLCHERNNFVYC